MSLLKKHRWSLAFSAGFAAFMLISLPTDFQPGLIIGRNFVDFLVQMLKLLPPVFVLIGLFDVWIKTETVERHLGEGAGPASYLWAMLLASTTIGGLHVALPVAQALYAKRARLSVILAFVFAVGICRIPMTLFEASFLGWRFTLVRFAVSLPLVVLASAALGHWCEARGYRLPLPDETTDSEDGPGENSPAPAED